MDVRHFDEVVNHFESTTLKDVGFELVELHSTPFDFGSGYKVYRVHGINVKLVFDGRDKHIEIFKTTKHENYPSDKWISIYLGSVEDFFSNVLKLF